MEHERWSQLMAHDGGRLPLAASAAVVAAIRTPGLDPDDLLHTVAALGRGCVASVDGICRRVFDELGFRGDADDYHHERNSLLDQVLIRRRGLPLTLSIVAHEVARTVGVDLALVAMPGHVVLLDEASGTFIDAFGGGMRLDAEGCEALFRRVNGPRAHFDPSMLVPTPHEVIVARLLSNLVSRYLADRDWSNARWALELRALVPGWPPEQNVDLAGVLNQLGAVEQAARVWDDIAASTDPERAAAARERARQIRSRLN